MEVPRKSGCLDERERKTQTQKKIWRGALVLLLLLLLFFKKKQREKGATLRGGVDECVDGGTLIGVIWS